MAILTTREAEETLARDPVEALEAARAEVGRIDLSPCDRARVWEEYAQACRVLGDYARADACYERAEELCTCRACLPRRHRRITYLRVHQGDYRDALRRAQEALATARSEQEVGRAEVAIAYVYGNIGEARPAIRHARTALRRLGAEDHLWAGSALVTISLAALSGAEVPDSELRELARELGNLSKQWPRQGVWRAHRARVRMIRVLIRDRLGTIRPAELRDGLREVQKTMVDLGLLREALEITAHTAELCAGMRREEQAARCVQAMLEALPSSLPRHVAVAIRKLRRSLEAVDRGEIPRAAAELRAAISLRSSPAV